MGVGAEPEPPLLIGYRHSVYTRAVRIALSELGVAYDWQQANPFTQDVALHPFRRVPVLLLEGEERLYETWAILTYIQARWGTPRPLRPLQAAREAQVASMVSAYAYWPLVRQVYSHAVFGPAMGEPSDPDEIAKGFALADAVLEAFEDIAAEGLALTGAGPADWLLFPMIDAFRRAPGAAAMLSARPALSEWWRGMHARDRVRNTFTALEPQGESDGRSG